MAHELTSQLLPAGKEAATASKDVDPALFKELSRLVAAGTTHDGEKVAWGSRGFDQISSMLSMAGPGSAVSTTLVETLKLLDRMAGGKTDDLPWLTKWRPLSSLAHADFSASHVVLDAKQTAWFYGFGPPGRHALLEDGARLCTSLLFEVTPIADEAAYTQICAAVDALFLVGSMQTLWHMQPLEAGKGGPLARRLLKTCQVHQLPHQKRTDSVPRPPVPACHILRNRSMPTSVRRSRAISCGTSSRQAPWSPPTCTCWGG